MAQDPNRALLEKPIPAEGTAGAAQYVVYDSTLVTVDSTGLSRVWMHRLVTAVSAKGARDLRTMVFGYDPLSAAIEVVRVRIYRKDGRVEDLPSSRIVDYPAPARAIYWGAREKLADIGRLEPGDAVETLVFRKGFTYALLGSDEDDRFVPPMRGHFYDIVEFWSEHPVGIKVYQLTVPTDKPVQYRVYHGELESSLLFPAKAHHDVRVLTNPQRPMAAEAQRAADPARVPDGTLRYTWLKRNIAPFTSEPNMVAASDVAPKLLLSTSPDWYAKALWFHGVNEDFGSFAVTPEIQAKTDSLLRGVTDEMEKISILTHWCAEEIRYSGISMGKGEGYTLHPGGMTMTDRCGVCKDKAGILITMLRAAGFASYPAMTMAGSRIDRIPADQFNHSVTLVQRSDKSWVLLDPTWVPGVRELWSSAEQQQEFLAGVPGGADLMTTPVSPADNHLLRLTGTSTLSADGTLEGELVLDAEGQSDASLRRVFARSFRSGWNETIANLFAALSPRADVTILSMQDPDDISAPMSITVRYRIPGYAEVRGSSLSFIPLLGRNPFNDRAVSSELYIDTSLVTRNHGFTARCSKLVDVKETITLPPHASVSTAYREAPVRGPAAAFEATTAVQGNTLTLHATHRMEKRVYAAEDWPAFRAALVSRLRLSQSPVTVVR